MSDFVQKPAHAILSDDDRLIHKRWALLKSYLRSPLLMTCIWPTKWTSTPEIDCLRSFTDWISGCKARNFTANPCRTRYLATGKKDEGFHEYSAISLLASERSL